MMSKTEQELEQALRALDDEEARDRQQRVLASAEVRSERQARRLRLERELCRVRQDEFADALELDLPVGMQWTSVTTLDGQAYLVCELTSGAARSVVFRFKSPVETRMGGLNDEVLESHELFGKGLDVCGFFVVRNSHWKAQMQQAMSVHPCFDPSDWSSMEHYLFRDKAGEFSCLARGYEYWLSDEGLKTVSVPRRVTSP